MRRSPFFAAAALVLLGLSCTSHAAEVKGVVVKVVGQRVTVSDEQGRQVAVSVPPGTALKPGDRVSMVTTTLGDAQHASTVLVSPK